MDDINIPSPNKALAAILLSDKMRNVVRAKTAAAKASYQSIVAKRTGRLAASARVEVKIGGYKGDRWVGRLIVGEGLSYGASHEFGTKNGKSKRAAQDLKKVLRGLRGS